MRSLTLLLILFLVHTALRAQHFPEPGLVYPGNEVSRIDILIPPDSLALIYSTLENEYEYHCTVVFHNSMIPHDTLVNTGFRLRGGTSLYSQKKSFKLSLNTYVHGRKYHGLEKMNLNGEHNDPGIIRSKLCWNLCRRFGIPASRSAHTEVYINGSYYGLYMDVEHVDENFVKSRFGNNNGNLYKCTWPADLVYLGNDPDLYKYSNNGTRAYELKTNTGLDDYSDLAHFIDVLNNTVSDSLHTKLDAVFNIQSYLKYLVFECITGQWDGYSYNKNNYYLYHNLTSGKFEFIPYDLDNTFGIDWMNIDWGQRNIYNWLSDEPRPLTRRLLQDPYYRKLFSFYMNQFLEDYFNQQALFPEIDSTYLMIYPYAAADPYRPLDYGWSTMQFTLSYTQALGAHVKYGLKPYIQVRNNTAMQQIVLYPMPSLVINEFMAENNTTIADEYGEYDDWIEIYNPGNDPVFLGDKYLTDDLNVPGKWQMPAITLDPDNYILIWADGEVAEGTHHANFNLSKDGEQLGIFAYTDQEYSPVDILTFGQQSADTSTGRYPNGTGITQCLTVPTPGASNAQPIAVPEMENIPRWKVFPNPFRDILYLQGENLQGDTQVNLVILDIAGRVVYRENILTSPLSSNTKMIRPGKLTPGMYFLSIQDQKAFRKTISILNLP